MKLLEKLMEVEKEKRGDISMEFKLIDHRKNKTHPCSSCDAIVPVDELDSYGRCQQCQEEYGDIAGDVEEY